MDAATPNMIRSLKTRTKQPADLSAATRRNVVCSKETQRERVSNTRYIKDFIERLPGCTFYFHRLDPKLSSSISRVITANAARVNDFFSAHVTHMIVRDDLHEAIKVCNTKAPAYKKALEDVTIKKAIDMRIKIWSLSSLQRLGDEIQRYGRAGANTARQGNDLAAHLRNETIYGTAGHRAEVHYFSHNSYYLLVEDTTGRYQPAIIAEYRSTPDGKENTWPRFYTEASNRSPFIRLKRTRQEDVSAKPGRSTVLECMAKPSENPPKRPRIQKPTANACLTPATQPSASLSAAVNSRLPTDQQQQSKSTSNLANTRCWDVSAASGLHPSISTAISTPSLVVPPAYQTRPSPGQTVERLGRKVMEVPDAGNNVQSPLTDDSTRRTSRTSRRSSRGKAKHEADGLGASLLSANTSEKFSDMPRRAGFCESCCAKFDDLVGHAFTSRHRQHATNDEHWKLVDDTLEEFLQDPILVMPPNAPEEVVLDEEVAVWSISPDVSSTSADLDESVGESCSDDDNGQEEGGDNLDDDDIDDDEGTTSAPCLPAPSTDYD